MTAPVLHVEGLRKVFGAPGTGEDLVVLDHVDLDVHEGELLSIIGPSGCGKTTLLHVINGLESATSGIVEVDRESMATVFQRPLLLPWRTVLQNACFAMECRGEARSSMRERATEVLGRVGLGSFLHFYPHEISRGMRQRVDLARALLVRPSVLLMDEPYASLDVDTRRAMQDDLLALREEYRLTVLFVSHQLDEVVTLADRVLFLSAKPTRVRHETDIDLPRPRNRGLEGKIAFVKQVEALTGFFQDGGQG